MWYFVRQEGKKFIVYRRINLYGGDGDDNIQPMGEYDTPGEAYDNCETYNKRMS